MGAIVVMIVYGS